MNPSRIYMAIEAYAHAIDYLMRGNKFPAEKSVYDLAKLKFNDEAALDYVSDFFDWETINSFLYKNTERMR